MPSIEFVDGSNAPSHSGTDHAFLQGSEPIPAEPLGLDLSRPLTLDEVFNFTLDNHPLLRARHHEIDIERGKLLAASLWPNPQLVLDTDSPVASEDPFEAADPTQLGGRLEFTIPTGGKRRAAQEVARAAIRRASFAVGREMYTVLSETAAAALEVLYLQEMIEVRKQLVNLAEQIAAMQRALVQGGVITDVQKLIAEVDALDTDFDRRKSVADLEVAHYRLSQAMGLSDPQAVQMAGRLTVEPVPNIPLAVVLQVARESRPEIKEARAAILEAQREVDLARAEAVPDIQFGPRWQDNIGRPDDSVGARFSTDLPIFNWNQGAISEMSAQVCVNRAMLRVAEITSLSDVASAYAQLKPIEETLEFYEKRVLPLADKAEAAIRATEETNVIDPVRLSLQLRKAYQVRLNYLEMRYLHNQLRVRIELFLGCRLADLEERMNPAPADGEIPDGAVIETEELPAGAAVAPESKGTPRPRAGK